MASLRLQRLPLQYIFKKWDFCGAEFFVEKPVLIPRPETEELVDKILKDKTTLNYLPYSKSKPSFLEIGCGSGVISITLLKKLQEFKGFALDISEKAIELTLKNASLHSVGDRLSLDNTSFQDFIKNLKFYQKHQIVVSNPPYISSSQLSSLPLEIILYEDKRALDGGRDGLDLIKNIIHEAHNILTIDGSLWLEISFDHSQKVEEIIKQNKNLKLVNFYRDFMHKIRFCHAVRII